MEFANYRDDILSLGEKPSKSHSLDRIDNGMGYFFGNVRWSDASAQTVNQRIRNDNTSGYKNITWCKTKKTWFVNVRRNKKNKHVGCFNSVEIALQARDAYILSLEKSDGSNG
jgi:Tfp pilus assembly protein PilX